RNRMRDWVGVGEGDRLAGQYPEDRWSDAEVLQIDLDAALVGEGAHVATATSTRRRSTEDEPQRQNGSDRQDGPDLHSDTHSSLLSCGSNPVRFVAYTGSQIIGPTPLSRAPDPSTPPT